MGSEKDAAHIFLNTCTMAIIYLVTNNINGKKYVGFTVDSLAKRWARHLRDASRGSNYVFHMALQKYGPENFTIKELISCEDAKYALEFLEPHYILLENSFIRAPNGGGYNMTLGGKGSLGLTHSEETKQKMSEIKSGEKSPWFGKRHTEETKQKMKTSAIGRTHTEESKKKMSLKQTGRICSDETRKKMSLSRQNVSQETREKIGKSSKGRIVSEETRKKLSKALTGRSSSQIKRNKEASNENSCH